MGIGLRRAGVATVVASALLIAACGGGADDGSSGGSDGKAKDGGSITIAETSQPDFLDPALTYTVNGIEPLWLVYTPLLTYPHEEGAAGSRLVPGLAEDMPKISKDDRTYQLTLRKGLSTRTAHRRLRTSSTPSSGC